MPVRQTLHALGASRAGAPAGPPRGRVPLHCRARCELDTGHTRLHAEPGTATIVSRPHAALHACLRADAHPIERELADHDQNRESLGRASSPAKGCLDQKADLLSFALSAIFSFLSRQRRRERTEQVRTKNQRGTAETRGGRAREVRTARLRTALQGRHRENQQSMLAHIAPPIHPALSLWLLICACWCKTGGGGRGCSRARTRAACMCAGQ